MGVLTAGEVKKSLVAFGVPVGARIAVAVSGGGDSIALLLLAHENFDVVALTVDHDLRDASSLEVERVAAQCNDFGIEHRSFVWAGKKPSGNIQAEARDARYGLMTTWCRENGVKFLAAAHHMDDQAETVLLRLARGSGVYGLAGMAPTRDMDGVTLVRPLLPFSKASLLAYLRSQSVAWMEDPSNRSDAFDRVKIRNLLADPPVEGLRADRLASTAGRLRRSRDALEHYEAKWLHRAVRTYTEGYAKLDLTELESEPEEIVLRGLASLCRYAGKGTYVPRMEKLLRLFRQLKVPGFRGQTLYGAQFAPLTSGKVIIFRELNDCQVGTSLEETCTWDNRFEISAKGDIAGLEIRALGEDGWRQLKASDHDVSEIPVPRSAMLALPSVFRGNDLQMVPQIGYGAKKDLVVNVGHKRTMLTKK